MANPLNSLNSLNPLFLLKCSPTQILIPFLPPYLYLWRERQMAFISSSPSQNQFQFQFIPLHIVSSISRPNAQPQQLFTSSSPTFPLFLWFIPSALRPLWGFSFPLVILHFPLNRPLRSSSSAGRKEAK
jgi:hypothetical protein